VRATNILETFDQSLVLRLEEQDAKIDFTVTHGVEILLQIAKEFATANVDYNGQPW
jgi:hypothetical protein